MFVRSASRYISPECVITYASKRIKNLTRVVKGPSRSVVSSLVVFSPIMSRTRVTFNGACTAAKLMRQDTMARFTATKRSEFPPRHGPPVSRCPRPIDSPADYVFIDSSFLACSLRTSNFIRVCRDVYTYICEGGCVVRDNCSCWL